MFTGIVTGIGTVRKAVAGAGGLELTIQSPYRGLEPGESVAVDGACLTVEAAPGRFSVPSSARRSTGPFEEYAMPRVNLERALQRATGGRLSSAPVDGVERLSG